MAHCESKPIISPWKSQDRKPIPYRGATVLVCGVVRLNRPVSVIAIPDHLTLGGSAPENKDDGVIWDADGQVSPSSIVTVQGTQPSFLDLNGHKVTLSKVILSKTAVIRMGKGGTLQVKQLIVDGKRPHRRRLCLSRNPGWRGTGQGDGGCARRCAGNRRLAPRLRSALAGNIANLIGNTTFAYPASGCDVDVITNGFTLKLDSGNGNAFACTGSISGSGNVEFFMGPSYTGDSQDALRCGWQAPNRTPRPASSSSRRGACNWKSPTASMRFRAT